MKLQKIYPLTQVTEFRFKLFPKNFYKVREFYENVLGYPVIEDWDGEKSKGVMLDVGGMAVIELLLSQDEYKQVQGTGLALMVKDVWTLWEKVKDHPNIIKPLSVSSWGDAGFRIKDPEGLQITFFTHNSEKS